MIADSAVCCGRLLRLATWCSIFWLLQAVSGHGVNRTSHAGEPAEQRLIRHLLRHYDVDARGVSNVNSTVLVEIELMLLRMQQLDERSQVLTTTGIIICDWQDDRLRWTREDYDGLHDVVMRPDRIWLPELALMNGAELLTPDFSRVRVLVRHDGHVHWEPGGVFTTTCDIDVRYFPFDDQFCSIQFGAWAYYSARMNITNVSTNVSTQGFRLNGEWDLFDTSAEWKENTLACCPNTRYPYVEFIIHLRRRHAFYVMNVIVPCALLSVLALVVFYLPPDAGEKISLGISVVLAIIVFLLLVAETVPRTSLHIPVMVIYLTCTMALGTISVCLTVLVLNFHHRDSERPVPRWARVLVLDHLARFMCLSARKPKTMAENRLISRSICAAEEEAATIRGQLQRVADGRTSVLSPSTLVPRPRPTLVDVDEGGGLLTRPSTMTVVDAIVDHRQDWKELAHVLDRLYFWLILVAMTATTMIIVLAPVHKQYFRQ